MGFALGKIVQRLAAYVPVMALAGLLAACTQVEIPPYLRPLSKDTMMLLGKKGMDTSTAIYIRVFKEESELELWKQRDDGRFYHFKNYPICNWSGGLGPKIRQGDHQAPEGFYRVPQHMMNPNSQFHLAFNLGYPNTFDKVNNRTGDFLMIHGKCKSAGCYAMTDALVEEIYSIAREAFKGGQEKFEVHAYPFRMTPENMKRHAKHQWMPFWKTLKEGYDHFEMTHVPPTVAICERRYVVNVKLPSSRIEPDAACPAFERPQLDPFTPVPRGQQVALDRVVVPGPKVRATADASQDSGGFWSRLTSGKLFGLGFGQ